MKILFGRLMLISTIFVGLISCTSYDHDIPNTSSNQTGFERHFGFAAPNSVSDLYYYADELGAGVKYQLGFQTDEATVMQIATKLELNQTKPELEVGLASEFPWWDEQAIEGLIPYWKTNRDKDYYWYLWYDSTTQRVYYIEFSL